MAIASFLIGSLSLFFTCIALLPLLNFVNCVTLPSALFGLLLGIVAWIRTPEDGPRGLAVSGVVLNLLTLLIGGAKMVVSLLTTGGAFVTIAAASPSLAPSNLRAALRHEREIWALLVALLTLGLLLVLLGLISWGLLVVLLPLLLWVTAVLLRIEHQRHLGNTVRVSAHQFPEIAREAARVAAVLQSPPFEVLILESPVANAYAFGWWYPQVVVLTSALVDMMTLDELRFVLGHEVGHIVLGHTRISSLLGGMLGAPNIPVLSLLGGWAFRWWSRLAEYSADRAGVIAAGDLVFAEGALAKLLVGPRLAAALNMRQVLAQEADLERQWGGRVGESAQSHPYLLRRLRALHEFWTHEGRTLAGQNPATRLPVSPASAMSSSLGPRFGVPPRARWERGLAHARPALEAAARGFGIYLGLAALALWLGWASLPLTSLSQILVGLFVAWRAARVTARQGPTISLFQTLGQAVGATWLLLLAVNTLLLLMAMIAGLESAGLLFPLMAPYALALPLIGSLSTLLAVGVASGVWWLTLRSRERA